MVGKDVEEKEEEVVVAVVLCNNESKSTAGKEAALPFIEPYLIDITT